MKCDIYSVFRQKVDTVYYFDLYGINENANTSLIGTFLYNFKTKNCFCSLSPIYMQVNPWANDDIIEKITKDITEKCIPRLATVFSDEE